MISARAESVMASIRGSTSRQIVRIRSVRSARIASIAVR